MSAATWVPPFTALSKSRTDEVEHYKNSVRDVYEITIGPRSVRNASIDEEYRDWNERRGLSALPTRIVVNGVFDSDTFEPMFIFRICEKIFSIRLRLKNVSELRLAGSKMGDLNFLHMLAVCQTCLPNLRVLNASDCNLTDTALMMLGRAQLRLQVLDFSRNGKVTDTGALHFFVYLARRVSPLHSLSLARTGVKGFFLQPGVIDFLTHVECSLERVDLRGCMGVKSTFVVKFLTETVQLTKLNCFMPGLTAASEALTVLEGRGFFRTNKNLAVMHMPGPESHFEYGLDEYMRLKSSNQGLKVNALIHLNGVRGSLVSRFFRAQLYRPLCGGRFQQMVVAVFLCNGELGWGVRLGEEVVRYVLSFLKMADF